MHTYRIPKAPTLPTWIYCFTGIMTRQSIINFRLTRLVPLVAPIGCPPFLQSLLRQHYHQSHHVGVACAGFELKHENADQQTPQECYPACFYQRSMEYTWLTESESLNIPSDVWKINSEFTQMIMQLWDSHLWKTKISILWLWFSYCFILNIKTNKNCRYMQRRQLIKLDIPK